MFNVGDIVRSKHTGKCGFVPSLCKQPRMYTFVHWFDSNTYNLCRNDYLERANV